MPQPQGWAETPVRAALDRTQVVRMQTMETTELPESVSVLRRILFEGFATGNTVIVDELCS